MTRGEYEAARAPFSYLQANGIAGLVLPYISILLSFYLRIEVPLKQQADRLILRSHRIAAIVLGSHVVAESVAYGAVAPDWFRLRAWPWLFPGLVGFLGLLLLGPLTCRTAWRLPQQMRLMKGSRNRELRNSLLKLLTASLVSDTIEGGTIVTDKTDRLRVIYL